MGEMTPTGEVETQETVNGSLVEAAAVESAGCYRFQNGACGLMLGVIDKSSCFSSKAACETCYENEGGMCVKMHKPADGSVCFSTATACEHQRRLEMTPTGE